MKGNDCSEIIEKYNGKKSIEAISKHENACRLKSPSFLKNRADDCFEKCFSDMCNKMDISIEDGHFIQFYDFDYVFNPCVGNISPAYDLFLNNGLSTLKFDEEDITVFCQQCNSVIDSVVILINRIIEHLLCTKPSNYKNKITWFENMRDISAQTFEEALQRVIFLGQLLWQTGSRLVGLGRLDCLLRPFFWKDVTKGATFEDLYIQIKDFMEEIHKYYWYKSDVLLGDTGQVMTIGGENIDGEYIFDKLSVFFLQAVKEMGMSDPKVVLRVSSKMPLEVMDKAVECMLVGNGSPLLSNDDVIIPILQRFGVDNDDSYNYTTSACWEPLVGGMSSSMNNQACLSFPKALQNLFLEEKLDSIHDFSELEGLFFQYIRREIVLCEKKIVERKTYRNTLYSIFVHGCYEDKADIVNGGAKYHNAGMTTVGLGNVVNALLNIDDLVFKQKAYSLLDVKKIMLFDFLGYDDLYDYLKKRGSFFGKDDKSVVMLTNRILQCVSDATKDFVTPEGGRLKFGVSSPSYIFESKDILASMDGRKKGEPFMVHISNEKASSYTELISFAGLIDYGDNRFNGNVLDLLFAPSFLEHNIKKISLMFFLGINRGFFQLQTNTISSEKLIAAKNCPEEYQDLIVRVWGFSAYFVQLPEDFKDLLIRRAMENEAIIR